MMIKTYGLFVITAIAEILGCYLPYLWLKHGYSVWLLVPAVFSLALFVWLLTLHPQTAGRVYAAYGGVYISVALIWLWAVDSIRPTVTDWARLSQKPTGSGQTRLFEIQAILLVLYFYK